MVYRGASYNIPIAIWITRDYPRQPPIAYVVPTNEMLVRASKDMDVSGRCRIEYLRNWEKKSEVRTRELVLAGSTDVHCNLNRQGCNLVFLLEAMQDKFSREPPVYAKPKSTSTASQQADVSAKSNVDYSGRPPPPLPKTEINEQVGRSLSAPQNNVLPHVPAKPGNPAVSSVSLLRSSSASTAPIIRSRSQSPAIGHAVSCVNIGRFDPGSVELVTLP